jgi:phosphoglycolate phosphatase
MFDLDGTLVQTRRASWDVFRTVSDDFGLGLTGPQEYFALFNGNIFASLEVLCQGRADSGEVKKAFLDRLRAEYNPAMVPGMVDVIRRLAGHCTLAVVSSNAIEVLRRVLVGNDVAYCFSHVFGGDMAPDKAVAIRSFLSDASSQYGRRCEVAYDETPAAARPDLATTVLVTDTAGDVRDALDVGIRAVGVAWGMHAAEELSEAGAEFVAIWPQELPGYLIGDTASAPAGACAIPAPPGGCAVPAPPGGCAIPAPAAFAGASAAAVVVPGPVLAASAGASADVAPAAYAGGSCGADECHCGCQEHPGPAGGPAEPGSVAARLAEPGSVAARLAEPGSVAARLAAAAAVRRERRRQAGQAPHPPVPSGGDTPSLQLPAGGPPPSHRAPPRQPAPAAELRDAVRRILAPAPGRLHRTNA